MGLRLLYEAATGQGQQVAERVRRIMAATATLAMGDAANFAKTKGRANIASAGFSKRWQNALRANVYPSGGKVALDPAALIYHKIPYAGVFENGATIAGSPLLWLPLPNVPTTIRGRHMTPANYIRLVGPLHFINRPGKPPLLAGYMLAGSRGGPITIPKLAAGARAAKRQLPGAPAGRLVSVPLFFGISKVTLAKRFNLKPIFNEANAKLGEFYLKNLKVP